MTADNPSVGLMASTQQLQSVLKMQEKVRVRTARKPKMLDVIIYHQAL